MDDVPSTLPTPLMLKLVGAPPDKLHASVEELPETIELGVAVKELITGAVVVGAHEPVAGPIEQ